MNINGMQSIFVFRPGKKIDNVKTCVKCQFYESKKERCTLFGNMNLVNGHIEYNFASFERNELGNCGPDAIHWKSIYSYPALFEGPKKPKPLADIRREIEEKRPVESYNYTYDEDEDDRIVDNFDFVEYRKDF